MYKIFFISLCLFSLAHGEDTKPVMSQEKFIKFKTLAPDVLDIINNQMNKIATCFSNEITQSNADLCIKQTGQPIESLIQKVIPSKTNILCEKNQNGSLHFVWSKEHHNLIVEELKIYINQNIQNKECLLHSNTVEEYGNCLVKSKSAK
ncbi:hypothetical protein [Sulfuricurvum sp.]|uniref:hypothetical protein n=1 Tax=Sulfuricurvum sp. TaxID=2025608 RepID=UPI002623A1A5|nr:hypothetical protein [Sulfuricurvum sp.]MDD2781044.1 hypothetical protein [Sulfuricurvum sp.]